MLEIQPVAGNCLDWAVVMGPGLHSREAESLVPAPLRDSRKWILSKTVLTAGTLEELPSWGQWRGGLLWTVLSKGAPARHARLGFIPRTAEATQGTLAARLFLSSFVYVPQPAPSIIHKCPPDAPWSTVYKGKMKYYSGKAN